MLLLCACWKSTGPIKEISDGNYMRFSTVGFTIRINMSLILTQEGHDGPVMLT